MRSFGCRKGPDMGRYCAADVAACIVDTAIENGTPVSNLQLQKILFFAQCEYMSSHEYRTLFDDDFEAWQYGPVVPSVYRTYSVFGGSPIWKAAEYREFDYFGCNSAAVVALAGDELDSVVRTVRKWACLPSWEIVNCSHRKGGAWDRVYNRNGVPGSGLHDVISLSTIRDTIFMWEV